jgi:hypothetical protein
MLEADEIRCLQAEQLLAIEQPLRPGHVWYATPYQDGWVCVDAFGSDGLPYVGGRLLMREDGLRVRLSSNPGIHGFGETQAVLAELRTGQVSGESVAAEIERRTRQRIKR